MNNGYKLLHLIIKMGPVNKVQRAPTPFYGHLNCFTDKVIVLFKRNLGIVENGIIQYNSVMGKIPVEL